MEYFAWSTYLSMEYGSGVMEHSRTRTEHGGHLLSNLVATIVMGVHIRVRQE